MFVCTDVLGEGRGQVLQRGPFRQAAPKEVVYKWHFLGLEVFRGHYEQPRVNTGWGVTVTKSGTSLRCLSEELGTNLWSVTVKYLAP